MFPYARTSKYEFADKDKHKERYVNGDEELQNRGRTIPLDRHKVASQEQVFSPTFYGMPYNEETYFTTGEPMDLAFRLQDQGFCLNTCWEITGGDEYSHIGSLLLMATCCAKSKNA